MTIQQSSATLTLSILRNAVKSFVTNKHVRQHVDKHDVGLISCHLTLSGPR